MWVNKLLVVKKGLINTIINYIHGPGARGAEGIKQSTWAPRGLPGRFWGFPEGYFGGGAEVPRGVFWGGGWGSSRGILGRGLGFPRGIWGRGLGNWGAGLDRESGLPCGLQEAKRPQPPRTCRGETEGRMAFTVVPGSRGAAPSAPPRGTTVN